MDLLKKMLAGNPKQRISAKLALSHPYFDSVEMKEVSSPASTLNSQRRKWWSFDELRCWYGDIIDMICSLNHCAHILGKVPSPHWIIPTMTPNKPKALPKISTTNIFTNESGFWASAIAHPDPDTPTHILNYYAIYTHRRDCWILLIFRSRRAHTQQKHILPNPDTVSTDLQFFPEEWSP